MRPLRSSLCWCGDSDLRPLRSDYGECRACGTLVFSEPYAPARYRSVGEDESGFYGKSYWLEWVPQKLGLPTLESRAQTDLFGRSALQLQSILKYCDSAGSLLELGCSHGGLTYLLGLAGFDAEGLELSPWVVEQARQRFGIEVLRGPLEALEDDRSYRAMVAVDLLEHLPSPVESLKLWAGRLTEDGTLFLQTPCYRDEGPDWKMLVPEEHLFLFNESSVRLLLERAGFETVEIQPAIFEHDMWIVATRKGQIERRSDWRTGLSPILEALLDCSGSLAAEREKLEAIEADRQGRGGLIQELDEELRITRADQQDKARLIEEISSTLEESRADQSAKEALILSLSRQLESTRADQQDKARLIEEISSTLEESRADQSAKEALILSLSRQLESTRVDQQDKARLIEEISSTLEESRADQSAKEALILSLSQQREELERLWEDERARLALVENELAELRSRWHQRLADRLDRLLGRGS